MSHGLSFGRGTFAGRPGNPLVGGGAAGRLPGQRTGPGELLGEDGGALESRAGWKGLCRKGVTLLIVLVGRRLDMAMGSNFIRDAVVIAFIANETISIIENAGLMGLPIPAVIIKAIEVLKKKAEREDV